MIVIYSVPDIDDDNEVNSVSTLSSKKIYSIAESMKKEIFEALNNMSSDVQQDLSGILDKFGNLITEEQMFEILSTSVKPEDIFNMVRTDDIKDFVKLKDLDVVANKNDIKDMVKFPALVEMLKSYTLINEFSNINPKSFSSTCSEAISIGQLITLKDGKFVVAKNTDVSKLYPLYVSPGTYSIGNNIVINPTSMLIPGTTRKIISSDLLTIGRRVWLGPNGNGVLGKPGLLGVVGNAVLLGVAVSTTEINVSTLVDISLL